METIKLKKLSFLNNLKPKLFLIQLLLLFIILPFWHHYNFIGVDYYFYKVQKPWAGGSTYVQECILQGFLGWLLGAGKSKHDFFVFCISLTYLTLTVASFYINKSFDSIFKIFFLTTLLLFHSVSYSLATTLGYPDPLTIMFSIVLGFSTSPAILFFSSILGVLSHPTQFIICGFFILLLRSYILPQNIFFRSDIKAIFSGLIIGKMIQKAFMYLTFSVTTEERLRWVTERNFDYWYNFNLKTIHEYFSLHEYFWPLAIAVVFLAFFINFKWGVISLASLILGLVITFVSEDRPRVFLGSIFGAYFYILIHLLKQKKYTFIHLAIYLFGFIGIGRCFFSRVF